MTAGHYNDCGQSGVCATPPGCCRHWEERNRELAAEVAALRDPKLEELKRALWAADDAVQVCAQKSATGHARVWEDEHWCDECDRVAAADADQYDAEQAILAHIREQRPKGER